MTETQLRQQVVNQIKSWVGYNNADGSHKKIIDIYNSHKPLARGYKLRYTDAWCAGTVSAVAIACGLTDIMPTEVGVGEMIKLYQRLGRWEENDAHVPRLGDVIVYAWSDNGVGDCTVGDSHVGIVTDCDGKTITATEGNMIVNGVHLVGYRTIPVNGRYIRGFGLPDYASKATEDEVTEETVYIVKTGDTLSAIAAKYGTTYQALAAYNSIVNPSLIYAGQKIRIPKSGSTKTAEAPETREGVVKVELNILRNGSKSNQVRAMQILLIGRGYSCGSMGADGDFGQRTYDAVIKFQKAMGIDVDGVCGSQTWTFLLTK